MKNKIDYKYLSTDEIKEFNTIKDREIVSSCETIKLRKSLFHKYPKAARHHIQLFPNHYLDIMDLRNTESLRNRTEKFEAVLNSDDVTERKLLNQINDNKDFFIIGSILKKHYNFGHHEAHVFREFPLGSSFKVDYLILGRNSDGWHFVFVELEAPVGSITIADGELGSTFRKGIKQINDWDAWLEQHFHLLQEYLNKHIKNSCSLPDEFLRLDKTRINYAVVAGRRDDFSDGTYRTQRKMKKEQYINLIHYDNLLDGVEMLYSSDTY